MTKQQTNILTFYATSLDTKSDSFLAINVGFQLPEANKVIQIELTFSNFLIQFRPNSPP